MATNFRVKMGKIGRIVLFVALAFQNGREYRHYDFKRFVFDDLFNIVCKFGELWLVE